MEYQWKAKSTGFYLTFNFISTIPSWILCTTLKKIGIMKPSKGPKCFTKFVCRHLIQANVRWTCYHSPAEKHLWTHKQGKHHFSFLLEFDLNMLLVGFQSVTFATQAILSGQRKHHFDVRKRVVLIKVEAASYDAVYSLSNIGNFCFPLFSLWQLPSITDETQASWLKHLIDHLVLLAGLLKNKIINYTHFRRHRAKQNNEFILT